MEYSGKPTCDHHLNQSAALDHRHRVWRWIEKGKSGALNFFAATIIIYSNKLTVVVVQVFALLAMNLHLLTKSHLLVHIAWPYCAALQIAPRDHHHHHLSNVLAHNAVEKCHKLTTCTFTAS